jgi:hypothetical protein
LGEAFPQGLSFGKYLGAKIGSISYVLDLDQDLAVRSKTNPYITDFALFRGHEGDMTKILGGMHTSISLSEIEGRGLNVAGKDWWHYFEKEEWPFDPANPLLYRYQQVGRDIALIVDDILDTVLAQPNALAFTYTLAAIGQTTNYRIEPADTEKIINKLDGLSKLSPGFDLEITPDREIKLYSPQKTRTLTGFALRQGHNCENFSYTENGPQATHLRGFAQGATRLGYIYNDAAQAAYRRITESIEFADVREQTLLQSRTTAEGLRQAAPAIEFSCSYINVDDDTDIWTQVELGDKIHVYAELEYDTLNTHFRLVGMECSPTDEGDEEVTLTFDDGSLSL